MGIEACVVIEQHVVDEASAVRTESHTDDSDALLRHSHPSWRATPAGFCRGLAITSPPPDTSASAHANGPELSCRRILHLTASPLDFCARPQQALSTLRR